MTITDHPVDQRSGDVQSAGVDGAPNIRSDHHQVDGHERDDVADPASRSPTASSITKERTSDGASTRGGQNQAGLQGHCAAASTSPSPASQAASSITGPPGSANPDDPQGPANALANTKALSPVLADPFLALAADILDDLERVKNANENRLRQLTRTEIDEDGVIRGLGLPVNSPAVAPTAKLVEASAALEHQAVLNLQRLMRKHPLGPWVKNLKGVGEKQAARLLAAVGDPYWNERDHRPRTVAELRSYCGWGDARQQVRRRGEQARWSDTAKRRTWVIVDSCKQQLSAPCKATRPEGRIWVEHLDGCACSPYRIAYDEARRKYEGTLHDEECRRCGPKGKPAQPGSERSPGHQEAMAYRVVCKQILKDLWREAARLHEVEAE